MRLATARKTSTDVTKTGGDEQLSEMRANRAESSWRPASNRDSDTPSCCVHCFAMPAYADLCFIALRAGINSTIRLLL